MYKWSLSKEYKVDLTFENQSMQFTILKKKLEKLNSMIMSKAEGKYIYNVREISQPDKGHQ